MSLKINCKQKSYMGISELKSFHSLPIGQMQSLAQRLAGQLGSGDIVTLSGEIGSGKTTFARAMIGAIAEGTPEVTSPTFTLMQSYDVKLADGVNDVLWHLDLYRLKNRKETEALGLDELWQHIVVIEWPDIIAPVLPKKHLTISFDFGKNHDTRRLVFSGDETWQGRLKDL